MNRAAWHARNPVSQAQDWKGKLDYVFIHHTAGVYPNNTGEEIRTMQGLEAYALDSLGYSDITYNWLIAPSGTVYEGRGFDKKSAATNEMNDVSRSICVMGNFMNDKDNMLINEAIVECIKYNVGHDQLVDGYPLIILGHRDNPKHPKATACPGDNLYAALPEIKENYFKQFIPHEGDEVELFLYQDARYANVFLVTTATVYQMTEALMNAEQNKGLHLYNKERHDPTLFSYMRKANIKASEMVQIGGEVAANFPADLK